MNKNYNTYIEYLNNVVTNLSITEEDKKNQKMYDIFITIMIFVPIIISSILIGFNQTLIGILLMIICWGLLFIIGTNRRKSITKRFYKIKDAHTKFNIINVNDEKTIKELYDDSSQIIKYFSPEDLNYFIKLCINYKKNNKKSNLCEICLKLENIVLDNKDNINNSNLNNCHNTILNDSVQTIKTSNNSDKKTHRKWIEL